VGVLCPIGVAEERERVRGNRTLGWARAHADIVHAQIRYDVTVDTSLANPAEMRRDSGSRGRQPLIAYRAQRTWFQPPQRVSGHLNLGRAQLSSGIGLARDGSVRSAAMGLGVIAS
jgi:Chloramphenicol phosphotransferase-like protein